MRKIDFRHGTRQDSSRLIQRKREDGQNKIPYPEKEEREGTKQNSRP